MMFALKPIPQKNSIKRFKKSNGFIIPIGLNKLSCDGGYNQGFIVQVMFENFAKILRAAGLSPIRQNFQISRVLYCLKIYHPNMRLFGATKNAH